ncbi:hypothetical protein HJG60_011006 [Phyllostomus discolor]|uniref:CAMPATH-1 antigen n=1 Tax=Phyllostomus discolor TaxID=89673 RepID=A0A834ADZ5_9CHIR|nr:hypothetical protein HJG60_011006 [Phyllostomus discolor]
MKGLFLLFTTSFLVMLQIQRGMLDTTASATATTPALTTPSTTVSAGAAPGTTARTTTQAAVRTPARTTARATTRTTARTTARATAQTTTQTTLIENPTTAFATTKRQTGAAPALSSLGGVSILIVLTNTFIQLFHLS